MKKLLGIVVLGLLWCNVSFAEKINLDNCNSNVPDSINIFGEKLPFWSVALDTTKLYGGELRRYPSGMEVRTVIYLFDSKSDTIYGYGLGHLSGIWEYIFNLKEPKFIVNELKSFPNDEQVKRIPKTDELMKALQTMRLFEKQEPLNYEVTCKK